MAKKFEAEHLDGSVLVRDEDGEIVLTSYLEPGQERLRESAYFASSGPRDAWGRIVSREPEEEEAPAAKKTAAKKSSAKK